MVLYLLKKNSIFKRNARKNRAKPGGKKMGLSMQKRFLLARKRLGMTQSELAEKLQQTYITVQRTESGKRELKSNEILTLKNLGINPEFLLGLSDTMEIKGDNNE